MSTADEWTGLDRTSTAERVAGILRDRIMEGYLRPGDKLSEEEITRKLGISRNTLREAFRLLGHERLLEHQLNRGVFVRVVDVGDLRDLYRVRRVIECAALREITEVPAAAIESMKAAVLDADEAAIAGRWPDVGTANLRFHQRIVALTGSPRIDELMRRVWAELRLVWHVIDDPRTSFERYVPLNHELLSYLASGELAQAEKKLEAYLSAAEEQFVAAYAEAQKNS